MTTSPQARLIDSASESDANMLWTTQFSAPDPFIFIEKRGKASERLKAAYRCVEEGQEIGFQRIREGVDAFGIHTEILAYFEANGFSTGMIDGRIQGFFPGTGHGLGLDIHEAPGINSRNHTILKTGHIVTVEPGIYYPGMGGVRLKDVVQVTKTGCRSLVTIPKILEV